MKVLLISANREEINMRTWPLGLACAAAATQRAGHEVKILDLMDAENPRVTLGETIGAFQPDLIGISVRNIDDQSMEGSIFLLEQVRDVVRDCKAFSNALIVLGGAGYSMFPESALEYLGADMGIQGEGEMALPALIGRIEQGADLSGVPGLYLLGRGLQSERSFVKHLDELPLPDAGLLMPTLETNEEFWLPVQTRRGCPMNCSYCSTATIEGCQIRKRSPEIVVQWLARWVQLGFHRFYFVDNTFNLPPSYAKALCSQLLEASLDITWRCILYPARLDEDLVRGMAGAGCVEVSVGFESGSELILSGMNKRFKPDDVRQVCALAAKYGIHRMGFLMLGGPGETKETALESLTFADSLDLDAVKISVGIRIYPHTALADVAVREGVIASDDDLLFPTFYVADGLKDWLHEVVQDWMAARPNWFR